MSLLATVVNDDVTVVNATTPGIMNAMYDTPSMVSPLPRPYPNATRYRTGVTSEVAISMGRLRFR